MIGFSSVAPQNTTQEVFHRHPLDLHPASHHNDLRSDAYRLISRQGTHLVFTMYVRTSQKNPLTLRSKR
ncbi:MAG: hypothetical protein J6R79_01110 [Bacteroidaceae bacterium]|nr:hypothetical protein [Bacteroidaceae bacterium]